jgi:hypothetical protein
MTLVSIILLSSVISQEGLQPSSRNSVILLVKIVENDEAQIIPIREIAILVLIINIYLACTAQYSYAIG